MSLDDADSRNIEKRLVEMYKDDNFPRLYPVCQAQSISLLKCFREVFKKVQKCHHCPKFLLLPILLKKLDICWVLADPRSTFCELPKDSVSWALILWVACIDLYISFNYFCFNLYISVCFWWLVQYIREQSG